MTYRRPTAYSPPYNYCDRWCERCRIDKSRCLLWQTEMDAVHGKAELIIGKQRHGPTDTVPLQFKADVTRFANLAEEQRLPEATF